MLQAEARAHRIGQTNPVTIYKLCTQGTVEEQMMGRIQKKLYLSAKVTESMRDIHSGPASRPKPKGRPKEAGDDDAPKMNTGQLMSLVRRGAQALSHPELNVDEMVQWDYDTMIEKCKDKPADIHVAEQTQSNTVVTEDDEKKWLAQIEQVESRVFQGKKFTTGKFVDEALKQDQSREARRVGKNTTVMVDGFAISKESMHCAQWEAVPTMAGKDPRLAEPVRAKRAKVVNQEVGAIQIYGCDNLLMQSSIAKSAGTEESSISVPGALEATTTAVWTINSRLRPAAKLNSIALSTNAPTVFKRQILWVVWSIVAGGVSADFVKIVLTGTKPPSWETI